MYRESSVYTGIVKVIKQIYLDYGITSLPVDEKEICSKMGVLLVTYSSFQGEKYELLRKISIYGFFIKATKEKPPMIFYNDRLVSAGAQRFTIFHELKHYVFEDDDDQDDDLADYFARYMMCPIPYLMLIGIERPNEIASLCWTSDEVARNVWSNIINRRRKYGYQLFDYEIDIVNQLGPELLEVYKGGDAYV